MQEEKEVREGKVTEKDLEASVEEGSEQQAQNPQAQQQAQAVQAQQAQQAVYKQAVMYGVQKLVDHHPRLRGLEQRILKHVNHEQLTKEIQGINEYLEKRGKKFSPEEKKQFFEDKLASYAVSGKMLDETAQIYILKTHLHKAKGISRSEAKEIRRGEAYLDKAMGLVEHLRNLLASGMYSDNKIVDTVQRLYEANFWNSTVDFLFENGEITSEKYKKLKRAYDTIVKNQYEPIKKGADEFAKLAKVAASILGFLGVGTILLSGANMTGNVVGSIGTPVESALGIFVGLVLIAGSFLLFRKK